MTSLELSMHALMLAGHGVTFTTMPCIIYFFAFNGHVDLWMEGIILPTMLFPSAIKMR
jgi:hypothetical protein